jgi:hypothetical protein
LSSLTWSCRIAPLEFDLHFLNHDVQARVTGRPAMGKIEVALISSTMNWHRRTEALDLRGRGRNLGHHDHPLAFTGERLEIVRPINLQFDEASQLQHQFEF